MKRILVLLFILTAVGCGDCCCDPCCSPNSALELQRRRDASHAETMRLLDEATARMRTKALGSQSKQLPDDSSTHSVLTKSIVKHE